MNALSMTSLRLSHDELYALDHRPEVIHRVYLSVEPFHERVVGGHFDVLKMDALLVVRAIL